MSCRASPTSGCAWSCFGSAAGSDAFNLAARVGAPIYVDDDVFEQAARPPDVLESELESGPFEEGEQAARWDSLSPELVLSLHPGPPKP